MKNIFRQFLFVVILLSASISAQQKFFVNLNDRGDKIFKVTLIPEKLSEQNKIFQFASTAPGTYQQMDVGRFVRSFKVYDEKGDELEVEQISTNQWELDDPEKTVKIIYTIADTWHTQVNEKVIYPMSGSNIESNNVLINGQCLFGYFHGMQKTPMKIKLEYPNDWSVGTALNLNKDGFYDAPDYDYIVDSPILLGKLSKASAKIENTNVDVYTYSKTGIITSDQILILLDDILNATSQFTQGLPVERYTFLFHFENFSAGAWEHNYSSEYVYKEQQIDENFAKEIRSVAAHEFYHIITPLNIHSELVGNFNFEKPTMSQHLWLYEGITEWAAQILQLRDYLTPLDEFLRVLRGKLLLGDNFDQNISLTNLSLNSTERQDQYPNIYQKGAVVACLLDIRLLELSKGTKGLCEVLNQLYKDYGVNKPFSEKNFFDEFVNRTYPEIADFINRYIKGSEKLPLEMYFKKLGIEYKEIAGIDSSGIALGFGIGVESNKFIVSRVDNTAETELRRRDFIIKLNGEEVNLQNAQSRFAFMRTMKAGDSFILTIERNGEQKDVKCIMKMRKIMHRFNLMEDAEQEQIALRNVWMKNLD